MNLHGELRREVIREGELESILGKHGHARGKRTAATTRTRRATIAKRPPLAARILAAVLGRLLGFLLRVAVYSAIGACIVAALFYWIH